jgi:membrane-associated protein
MTFLGYFLGKVLGAKQIEKVVYLIIFISVLPLFIGAIRHRMAAKKSAAEAEKVPATPKASPSNDEKGGPKTAANSGKASSGDANSVSQNSAGE